MAHRIVSSSQLARPSVATQSSSKTAVLRPSTVLGIRSYLPGNRPPWSDRPRSDRPPNPYADAARQEIYDNSHPSRPPRQPLDSPPPGRPHQYQYSNNNNNNNNDYRQRPQGYSGGGSEDRPRYGNREATFRAPPRYRSHYDDNDGTARGPSRFAPPHGPRYEARVGGSRDDSFPGPPRPHAQGHPDGAAEHRGAFRHQQPVVDAHTLIPTASVIAENRQYMLKTYNRPPLALVKGEGAWVTDTNGKQYLDLTSGISVVSMGHKNFSYNNLVRHQLEFLCHSSNLFDNLYTGQLCKTLVWNTRHSKGMHDAASVFICNSGTEANEAAIKFARRVGKSRQSMDADGEKYEIVSFDGAFHGRTLGALSATWNPQYQDPFAPLVPGFRQAKFNDILGLEHAITTRTAGVIVEPVQGESGIHVASDEFLLALAKRCREVGAVLIYDEIQCGLGRTGTFWAHSEKPQEMHPDMITSAKALGNGLPIGAVIVNKEVAGAVTVGDHGTTFGGNVLIARVANRVIKSIYDHKTLSRVHDLSKLFWQRLQELQAEFPELITEVRGRGLMIGVQLSEDPKTIVDALRRWGILVITAGTNTIRLLPTYIMNGEMVNWAMQVLKRCIQETRQDFIPGARGVIDVGSFGKFWAKQKLVRDMTERAHRIHDARHGEMASYKEIVQEDSQHPRVSKGSDWEEIASPDDEGVTEESTGTEETLTEEKGDLEEMEAEAQAEVEEDAEVEEEVHDEAEAETPKESTGNGQKGNS